MVVNTAVMIVLPGFAAYWAVDAAFEALGIQECSYRPYACGEGDDPGALEVHAILFLVVWAALFAAGAAVAELWSGPIRRRYQLR